MGEAGTDGLSEGRSHEEYAKQLEILNEIGRIVTDDLRLRPMLQRVTDVLASRFDWEFVAVVLIDRERGEFVCEALSTLIETEIFVGYRRAVGSGVVGEVAHTGRSILLDDIRDANNYVETAPGVRSELCVPVVHRGHVVAIVNLESRRIGAFHDQLQLVETVAEQMAGAIAHAQLYEELMRRAGLMEMVGEVTRLALEAGELDALLAQVVRFMIDRFELELFAILLVDPERREFHVAARSGESTRTGIGMRWPITTGVVGRSIRSGEPQLVLDVVGDRDYLDVTGETRSEYVVPLRFRDEILGALNFESTNSSVFSEENQVVFRTIANQIAGAIHMAATNSRLLDTSRELEKANQTLHHLSTTDSLTGVANRRSFDERFETEWRRAVREGSTLSLAMIDIDRFKSFNDEYGHREGDECLGMVASILLDALQRAGDFVARYGGEEFSVILPCTDLEHAFRHTEALRERVEQAAIPHRASPSGIVTISAGVATIGPDRSLASSMLIEKADRALYRAKEEGRNRVSGAG